MGDDKPQQTAQAQPTNIFVQTAATKLITGRKIGAIPGQHPPPFIQSSSRTKNAPFDS